MTLWSPRSILKKKLPQKGGGWHFFKKGGDTCQVGDDLKRGDPTPWDTMHSLVTKRKGRDMILKVIFTVYWR